MTRTKSLKTHTPAVVAHRGLSGACPENTMPSFGAAVALGVDEIELDIHPSKDGKLVVIHDNKIDRVSNAEGLVSEWTWEELKQLDAGSWKGESWKGIRFCRFEEVLEAFAGRVFMNIHVKTPGEEGRVIKQIQKLIHKYQLLDSAYVAGGIPVLEALLEYAPELERCCLAGDSQWTHVERAIRYQCSRLQFRNQYCNKEEIDKAHAAGIRCNLFYADTAEEAEKFLKIGMDAILTNNAAEILPVVRRYR